MRTSAYFFIQLPQMKFIHTGLEMPIFSHYFLYVCPSMSCFLWFLFVCVCFLKNLSSFSLFLTLIPLFHIYLVSCLHLLVIGERKNPSSYCLHLFSSLSTNVDFTVFMHAAQMMINTRLAHWKICRKLYRVDSVTFCRNLFCVMDFD